MDKVVEELLHPFAKRLAASSIGALVLFWGIGLLLFHVCHPQPLLFCRTGGSDLCGLLSGEAKRMMIVALWLLLAMVASSLAVFSRAAEIAQFLSGSNWHHLRRLGVMLQDRARDRVNKRVHSNLEVREDTPDPPRRKSKGGSGGWRRYPQGMSRHEHNDPSRASDEPLEPTYLGNVFAASRQRVNILDGLPLHRCWHVLLTILPQNELARLQAGSADLLLRTQTVIFCVATSMWAVWLPGWQLKAVWIPAWWFVAYLTYRSMCAAAGRYCDCLEAIITIYRSELYRRLELPPLMPTVDQQRTRAEHLGITRYVPPDPDTISLRREDEEA